MKSKIFRIIWLWTNTPRHILRVTYIHVLTMWSAEQVLFMNNNKMDISITSTYISFILLLFCVIAFGSLFLVSYVFISWFVWEMPSMTAVSWAAHGLFKLSRYLNKWLKLLGFRKNVFSFIWNIISPGTWMALLLSVFHKVVKIC